MLSDHSNMKDTMSDDALHLLLKNPEDIFISGQARLEAQQRNLQKRLKLALKIHHLCPRTSVDTMTIADKIVNALDKIAEVKIRFAVS